MKVDLKLDTEAFFGKYNRNRSVAIYTLGCKVNQYETEAMLELFMAEGYEVVEQHEFADVYIINTCTVTSLSDKKSRQFMRRAKRLNPDGIVAVVGCYAQVSPDEVKEIEGVNLILGTNDRKKIVEFVNEISSVDQIVKVEDIMSVTEFEELEIENVQGRTRAFLKIQEGCNQYCSYCIIPYARGPIRSRQLDNIVSEAKRLEAHGFKELVLTGIHVASYGKDLGDVGLLDVLEAVHEIQGIERIRLSSVEPRLMTDVFLEGMANLPKVCNHFHMSLQSGSDTVLKRMNRKYDTEEYFAIIEKIREKLKDVAFTTDIIVGFPGESDKEFAETLAFVEKVGFSKTHVFKYSPREGTPAATMIDQVDPSVKNVRSQELIELTTRIENEYLRGYMGRELEVIFEKSIDSNNTGQFSIEGFTDNYIRVIADGDESYFGKVTKVKIIGSKSEILLGKVVPFNI